MSLPDLSPRAGLPFHHAVGEITRALHQARLIHCCLTCEHWRDAPDPAEGTTTPGPEMCRLYQLRPPAKVIAYGCPSWTDGLPF